MLRCLGRLALLVALVAGCADGVGPGTPEEPGASGQGSVDPGVGRFVVDRIGVPVPEGPPVPVELIASGLDVDPEHGLVTLDVALHNDGRRPLFRPAVVWLSDFFPAAVRVTNADVPGSLTTITRWGFDYTGALGPDGRLDPDETSAPVRWTFHDPGLVAFSFSATVEMGAAAPAAEIRGVVFEDLNRNGIHERNEGPWPHGVLHLYEPGGGHRLSYCEQDGSFGFFVQDPGLYRLELESLVDCIVCFTTPNPLRVLLPVDEEGQPESFLMARFGAVCGPCDPSP